MKLIIHRYIIFTFTVKFPYDKEIIALSDNFWPSKDTLDKLNMDIRWGF